MWLWLMNVHTRKLVMRWCLHFKLKAQPTSVWGVFVHGQEKSLQREWVWAARWAEGWVEWRGHFGESAYEKENMPSHILRTVLLCKYDQKPRISTESLISDEWMEEVCFRMWAVGTKWVGESENSIASSPPHRLAHPPIFDIICTFNSIWVNKTWQ